MTFPEPAIVLLLGFILDCLVGDPVYRLHPIRIMGNGVSFFLKSLEKAGLKTRTGSVMLVLMTAVSSLGVYLIVRTAIGLVSTKLCLMWDVFICYSCIAAKDLVDHIQPVYAALIRGELERAREEVSLVVGRDVHYLDEAGVARAAVETLAENFVDGFLSPAFWYVIGVAAAGMWGWHTVITGVCFMIGFKSASTLDSMAGYKNEAFYYIGWAGARLDDLMNFIPARLSLVLLYMGARFSGLDAKSGFRIALKDRLKHDSPNSAHAESFTAGALGVRLGGPTCYVSGLKDKPWLNETGGETSAEHVTATIRLVKYSSWILISAMTAVLIALDQY